MIRIQSLATPMILGILIYPLIVNANPKTIDPLQVYRDEIKQTEMDASQALLDQLGPDFKSIPNTNTNTNTPHSSPPHLSNNDKALSPPTETAKNLNSSAKGPQANTNPWEKPNPWAEQSKINPWANAPIPGPTSDTSSSANSSPDPVSPPNIFAPPQSANMSKKTLNNSTNNTH